MLRKSDDDSSERSETYTKRRRRLMGPPEGFAKATVVPPSTKRKISVENFTSAFENSDTHKPKSPYTDQLRIFSSDQIRVPPGDSGSASSAQRHRKPQNLAPSPKLNNGGTSVSSKKFSVKRFKSALDDNNHGDSRLRPPSVSDHCRMIALACPETEEGKEDDPGSSSRHMRRLKPPIMLASPQPKLNHLTSHQLAFNITRENIPSASVPLSRMPPPNLVPRKSPVPLKHLPPLTFPAPPSPKREMKSIFTTRVARATDPMAEGGNAELFSMFLQGSDPLVSPSDRELQRGVLSSPQKGDKGKGPRFIRGGLAERASQMLTRSQNASTLWQREAENLRASHRLTPNIRFLVIKVLHITKPSDRFRDTSLRWTGIVLCRLLHSKSSMRDENYTVLLSSHTSEPRFSVSSDLKENTEIWVWPPWYQIDLPVDLNLDNHETDGEEGEGRISDARVALLCSRFYINLTSSR